MVPNFSKSWICHQSKFFSPFAFQFKLSRKNLEVPIFCVRKKISKLSDRIIPRRRLADADADTDDDDDERRNV